MICKALLVHGGHRSALKGFQNKKIIIIKKQNKTNKRSIDWFVLQLLLK